MVSISFLEARLRICYREVLCYDKLHIVKLLLLFKETVDLPGPIFSDFFLFHVKPSIAILTIVSKKNIEATASYLLNRIFEQSVNQPKVSFAAKQPGPWNSVAQTSPDLSCTW